MYLGEKNLLAAVIKCTVKGSNHCGEFDQIAVTHLMNTLNHSFKTTHGYATR